MKHKVGSGLVKRVMLSGNNMKLRNGQTKNSLWLRDPSFVGEGGEEGSRDLKL